MQGQRGIIGSLPETLEFDHASTSGTAIMDQHIYWNNVQNPAENLLADFMQSPGHVNNSYVDSMDQERQHLSGWSLGDPSSSNTQTEVSHDVQKTEHVWSSSSSSSAAAGPRLEERQSEPTNILSLESVTVNPQYMQSSDSGAIPQDLNLNASFIGHSGDNCHDVEASNLHKSIRAENELIPLASGSDSFQIPSGSGGYLEENDGRPGCSSDSRRHSCKRKAVEGNIGQSSMSGSSTVFQNSESCTWPGVPTRYDTGSSLSISPPTEQTRLELGVRGLSSDSIPDSTIGRHAESSRRNFRLRTNPSNQEYVPLSLFSAASAVRRSRIPSSHSSSRVLPVDNSLDFRSSPSVPTTAPQAHSVMPFSALPQNVPSFRWNESSSSGIGSSSISITSGDREETNSRSTSRNLRGHAMLTPATDLRALARNPAGRSVNGGNLSVSGNVAPASRTVSSLGVNSLSTPPWVPHPNPSSRNSRRLAEYVRRALLSVNDAESGGQSSTHSPLHSGPGSSEERALSSGSANQAPHRSYARSSSLMERPSSSRTVTGGSEERTRLVVSERIRNFLDLMRRGESLRFEDVMMLDQSVFLGGTDLHDRHRDMRLDVDNMSYEELLALEERIGNVSTGLSEETIVNLLKQRKYSLITEAEVDAEPCSICQEEYNDGEDVGTLDCGHDFHTDCIKQWLIRKNWCPICKTTGLAP